MKKEKVVLITGGAQGIGKGIAKKFLQNNISVIIVDNDPEAGKEIESEFSNLGNINYIQTDILNEQEIIKMIDLVISRHERIDYLINNAGIMVVKPIEKLSLDEWNRVLGINLTGTFLCTKYAVPHLKITNGVIINIASTRALMSEPNTESYSASKGGIVALTHSLALSLGPKIRVNCISPGWIEVSDWQKSHARQTAEHTVGDLNQHPAGRVGTPEDIASLVLYLISPDAGFITGANFTVDGGMTRKMIYV